MLWFGSKSDLYTVDLTTLSQLKIDSFISEELDPNPISAVADFPKEKYMVYYEVKEEFVLVYGEKGREPDVHIVDDILPKFSEIKSMDLNKNKMFCYVGGWSENIDDQTGKQFSRGCISCIQFDKGLQLMAEIELPKRKCSVVTNIVVSHSHEDVIFAATDGPLFILGFNPGQSKFEVLKAIDLKTEMSKFNPPPISITKIGQFGDMCLYGDCLFMVGGEEDENVTQVKFNNDI